MAGSPARNDVVQEISLLYELALAIGTSLDLEVNCETFLKTLVTRKNLDFAAVWLRGHHLRGDADESQHHLVSACPAFRARAEEVSVAPKLEALQPGAYITLGAGAPGFEDFAPGGVGVEGTTAVLPVGQLGLLQLYSRQPDGFSERELDQLRSVLRTLATSIEGCLAHRRLRSEVAERRRTATSLRAATSRLSALITNMQAGVLVEDEHRRIALANEAFCDLFGVPVPPDELLGTDCATTAEDVKHLFADPDEFIASTETLLAERKIVTSQEYRLSDGRILERDYIPIFIDDVFRGHLWQYHDVSERKRTEQEIVRLKNFYEHVLDKMPVQLAVFDTEGRYRYVTPSSVKDPTVREWLIGRTDVDYCHFRDMDLSLGQNRLETIDRVVCTQEEHAFEEAFVGRDGQEHHFLRVITPVVEEGRTVQVLGYGLDITERKQAERALRASEARYKQLVEEANDIIYQADTDGCFTYANPTALRLTGYSEEEVLGMHFLDVVQPEFHDQVRTFYERQVEDRETNSYLEFPVVTRDGGELWIGQNVRLLREEGDLTGFQAVARDITQRKRSEEALRESEERFQSVLRSLDAVVWSVAIPEERLLYINPAAERVYGRPISEFEQNLWLLQQVVHPEDRERVLAATEVFLGELTSQELEYRIVRPDGTVRWVNDRHTIVRTDEGTPLRVSGFITDITERKRAEEELTRITKAVEVSSDAIGVTDAHGRLIYQNQTFQGRFGFTVEEIAKMGGPVGLFADPERGREIMDTLMRGHSWTGDVVMRTARGTSVQIALRADAVTNEAGHLIGLIGICTDITARKRAEEALQYRVELENLVAEITTGFIKLPGEAVDEAIEAALGEVGTFVNVDRSYVFFFDEEEQTMSNTHEWCAPGIEPQIDFLQGVPMGEMEWWMDHLRAHEPIVVPRVDEMPPEAEAVRLILQEQDIQSVVVVPLVEGDRVVGFVGFDAVLEPQAWADDVVLLLRLMGDACVNALQRKRVEAELRRAKQAAEESAQAKERFLANMSHEMRTPLNAVVGMTHLLRTTEPSAEQARYLDGIQFSSDNLLALINDLLDIAKLEAGKVEFEVMPFDIVALLQRLDDTMQIRAREKGLLLRVEPDERLPAAVSGDPTRLSQILLNLVSNAVKFTEEGEVLVRAEPIDRDGGPAVRFEVRDTGIGISDEQLDRIFQSFTQARSDTTRKYGGTGLGLAIVKELVDRQQGEIAVESTEGAGTTFTVVLPLPPAGQEVSSSEETVSADAGEAVLEGAAILLVEDNEMNQLVAARMLRRWGAVVDVAFDGREAVARVADGYYDLVLMDVQMPEVDGVEATRRIREELGRSRSELPILALTASVLSDQRDAIEAAGMNDFILKPFDPDDLRRRIAHHLDHAPALQQSSSGEREVDLSMLERSAFGDEAFLVRMIDMFCANAPGQLQAMQEAAVEQDWQQVRFAAHKLKSSAAMIGAGTLREMLVEIEERVDEERTDAVPELVEQAAQRGARALEALEERRAAYA